MLIHWNNIKSPHKMNAHFKVYKSKKNAGGNYKREKKSKRKKEVNIESNMRKKQKVKKYDCPMIIGPSAASTQFGPGIKERAE